MKLNRSQFADKANGNLDEVCGTYRLNSFYDFVFFELKNTDLKMKRILQNSFFKCIDPENKSGITFVEVVIVGLLVPMVIRNIKNYVINMDKQNSNQESYNP